MRKGALHPREEEPESFMEEVVLGLSSGAEVYITHRRWEREARSRLSGIAWTKL